MSDSITLTGLVATPPRHLVTSEGLAITSFRMASTQRRFDRKEEKWIDADTNWYTVTAFRRLALNLASSLNKGERVIVTGRVRIRDWENAERSGTTVEIEADALGHDLSWGTAAFTRVLSAEQNGTASQPESAASKSGADTHDGKQDAVGNSPNPDIVGATPAEVGWPAPSAA